MKIKDSIDKVFVKQSARAGLMLIIVAAITLEATSVVQYLFSQKGIREEATQRAETQLEATKLKIVDIIDQTETAVRNSAWLAQWALAIPDSLWAVSRRMVETNRVIVGSTVALVPGYDKRHPLFSPYCFQAPGEDGIRVSTLATPEYDYPSQEWFTKPVELDAPYWSEPYVDVGGGDILMTTYSVPIHDINGKIAAVLTADISLDWLTELVGNVKVYPEAFSMLVSRSGRIMVCPAESLVMRSTIHEAAASLGDTALFSDLNRSMLAGESGSRVIRYKKSNTHVFFSPVEKTGWSMSIMIPDEQIFGNLRRVGRFVALLQILGLLLLAVILNAVFKNQLKLKEVSEKKEKMENELHIARSIQMAMIPKIFPPFPERHDLDMSATIVPAKEVGGDLYDFYIRDGKLLFCIGDVSGKGVPASLVMAVTRSLFRSLSAHENSPRNIITAMNDSMSQGNDSNMFVTFFLGILDLESGNLRYCNAGHNAPRILSDKIATLPVEANLPLGIMHGMEFKEQEVCLSHDDAIFLYTDGLTEAENKNHELFGEERMEEVLHTRRNSQEHLDAMKEAVRKFVGDAPQSDDLTALFIHYLGNPEEQCQERHLVLHNDVQQIPQLADFVETIASEKHLDQSLAMSLNLALEEAVTNVIMYAYPEGSDGLVDIEAILRPESLDFIITDSGIPFDPTSKADADITLGVEERGIGGLGIFLVRNIMDSVSYSREDGKNILKMTKKI